MDKYVSHHKILSKTYNFMSPILKTWIRINRDYVEDSDFGDSLFSYNERANVSTLAGAIWKCGGYALEEYSVDKEKGKGKRRGRVDLYFNIADGHYVSESKMIWPYYYKESHKTFSKLIKKQMQSALDDAKTTYRAESYADGGFAFVFIGPYWRNGAKANKDAILRDVEREILIASPDFYACYINSDGKDIVTSKGFVFNSIYIIGKGIN